MVYVGLILCIIIFFKFTMWTHGAKRFSIACELFGCEGYGDDECKECGGRVRDNGAY